MGLISAPVGADYVLRDGNPVSQTKVVTTTDYQDTPKGKYEIIDSSRLHKFRWINSAGYQEKDTAGKHTGSMAGGTGQIPKGQTRLARTGAQMLLLQGAHSGMGDGYIAFLTMATSKHSETQDVRFWSGQNSSGFWGGQNNALTEKVNLYAVGDLVLNDKGHDDVSMFGRTLLLYRSGRDSGDYAIPRVADYVHSAGEREIDAAYVVKGKFRNGIDLSQADFGGGAILLRSNQGIYWNTDVPGGLGQISSKSLGGAYSYFDGRAYIQEIDNAPVMRVRTGGLDILDLGNSTHAVRVYGASSNSYLSFGQNNTDSYITAVNSAAGGGLTFRTSHSGSVVDRVKIKPNGVFNVSDVQVYSGNSSALAAGLVVGDIFRTHEGVLMIVH